MKDARKYTFNITCPHCKHRFVTQMEYGEKRIIHCPTGDNGCDGMMVIKVEALPIIRVWPVGMEVKQ